MGKVKIVTISKHLPYEVLEVDEGKADDLCKTGQYALFVEGGSVSTKPKKKKVKLDGDSTKSEE